MEKRRTSARIVGTGIAFGLLTGPAFAHHSYVAYDMTRTLTAEATIKEFYWASPHSSASFVIMGPQGQAQDLTLQGGAPSTLVKQGLNPRELRRGLKVEITWHPLRSGESGGTLVSIKLGNGKVFKDNDFGNLTPPPPTPSAPPSFTPAEQ